MNLKKRCEIVRAMELLARQINDEDIFEAWLIDGVADGDIEPGATDDELEYYAEAAAKKSGGLYADGVISKPAGWHGASRILAQSQKYFEKRLDICAKT